MSNLIIKKTELPTASALQQTGTNNVAVANQPGATVNFTYNINYPQAADSSAEQMIAIQSFSKEYYQLIVTCEEDVFSTGVVSVVANRALTKYNVPPEIFERCNSVQEKLGEITKTISDSASIEEVQKLNKEIRKQMEYLLGESASDTFFRYNSPLSITSNGSIYAIYIFDIIYDFISKEIAQRSKKVNAAMDKYTEKYKK